MGCLGFLTYRFNRVFNVSKTSAAVIAVLCFIAGIPLLFGGELAMLTFMFWGYALIYGCIWYHKFNRDRKIVRQAQLEAQQYQPSNAVAPQSGNGSAARPGGDLPRRQATGNVAPGREQVIEIANEITSPGSSRWFVPPPIDRRD